MPIDDHIEVAFMGRFNAGKSSLIVALGNQKKLARTSSTPGRTQAFNVYLLPNENRLIDTPGYGYAKGVSKAKWLNNLVHYAYNRQSLSRIYLLTDCRHPLKRKSTWRL